MYSQMEEKMRAVIAAHNQMLEAIWKAGMDCKLSPETEIWDKIICESVELAMIAQYIGVDAKVEPIGEDSVLDTILLDKYPELSMYNEEDHIITLCRENPDPDAETYEVIFDIGDDRYYCFINGCDSLQEALGLFFQENPHISYSMIFEHLSV